MDQGMGTVLSAVSQGIQRPYDDSEQHSLALLSNLARNNSLRENLLASGVIEILFHALGISRGKLGTHLIFKSMAIFTNDLSISPTLGKAIESIIQLMERYIDDDKIQMNGSYILGTLAIHAENKLSVGRAGSHRSTIFIFLVYFCGFVSAVVCTDYRRYCGRSKGRMHHLIRFRQWHWSAFSHVSRSLVCRGTRTCSSCHDRQFVWQFPLMYQNGIRCLNYLTCGQVA